MALLFEKAAQPAFGQKPEPTSLRSGDRVIWNAQQRSLEFFRGPQPMFLCQFNGTPFSDISDLLRQLNANPERAFSCFVRAVIRSGLSLEEHKDKMLNDFYATFLVCKPQRKKDAQWRRMN